jgi:hypothetical protein
MKTTASLTTIHGMIRKCACVSTIPVTAALALAALTCAIPRAAAEAAAPSAIPGTVQTKYASFKIDAKGFITSISAKPSGKEYCPAGRPSPLLSLHESDTPNDKLVAPQAASYDAANQAITLQYPNGAAAVVKIAAKDQYLRFQLVALTPRGTVDNIVWGPLRTTVAKLIGDLLGVVRDDDWAIGLYGIDDNTIAGPVTDGDCYGMGYYIHSPDPVKFPLPPQYKEGQWFNIGGNGVTDTAFYSHPEEYFQQVFGNGAKLEPEFGSSLAYHARDRRKSYTHLFSLLPGFPRSRPRHQVSDPVDVDFIGSTVALYACPDDLGLNTLESIILAEGLPHPVIDGKWVRDPAGFRPTVYWGGPRDKCIEYTKALGLKDISQDTGEFYPCLGNNWNIGNVGFSNGKSMPFKEFTAEAHKQGLTNGGLHTLCVFLQGGTSNDVTPVPSEHLQTVCRTKIAKDISATDTEIIVTEPSFLAEKGTWTAGDDSNYLRIGGEMLRYDGISDTPPYTLKGVKRGHASTAQAHKAGAELVKLQQNCYNGFVPDMKLLLDYAEYYADLMFRNGMDTINFDGFESTVYQNHGYYGTRVFCRRLFETYAKLTGGKAPRVTGSNVFAGAWEFFNVCDVGGGNNMFDPYTGQRGIEGKDIGYGFSNSYFPGTFGIQGWHSDWSLFDAQNLQAKAIGWEATYALSMGQDAIDKTGEKEAIFKAFRAWQVARAAGVFTRELRTRLKDPAFKFHLEQTGETSFTLYPVKELRANGSADGKPLSVANPYGAQPLQLAIRMRGDAKALAAGITVTLPDGSKIITHQALKDGELIIAKGQVAYLADANRNKTADLKSERPATLPAGEAKLSVTAPAGASFELVVWTADKGEKLAPKVPAQTPAK